MKYRLANPVRHNWKILWKIVQSKWNWNWKLIFTYHSVHVSYNFRHRNPIVFQVSPPIFGRMKWNIRIFPILTMHVSFDFSIFKVVLIKKHVQSFTFNAFSYKLIRILNENAQKIIKFATKLNLFKLWIVNHYIFNENCS